ncbi:MAG: hypothetical protein GF320_04100 [Armatimonadia bacterium]|nr:hypothetical protein [Armatimonadia bacterium]
MSDWEMVIRAGGESGDGPSEKPEKTVMVALFAMICGKRVCLSCAELIPEHIGQTDLKFDVGEAPCSCCKKPIDRPECDAAVFRIFLRYACIKAAKTGGQTRPPWKTPTGASPPTSQLLWVRTTGGECLQGMVFRRSDGGHHWRDYWRDIMGGRHEMSEMLGWAQGPRAPEWTGQLAGKE